MQFSGKLYIERTHYKWFIARLSTHVKDLLQLRMSLDTIVLITTLIPRTLNVCFIRVRRYLTKFDIFTLQAIRIKKHCMNMFY